MIPILFVGGGRRVELAQKFMDRGFEVFAYETDIKSPIADIAQKVFCQPTDYASNEVIYDDIVSIMKNHDINLCIPLTDKMSDFCASWGLPISASIGACYCYRKNLFAEACRNNHYYPHPTSYPVIYKPVHGNGSKDLHIIKSWWSDRYKKNNAYVGQKWINGEELSIDCYFDKYHYLIGYCIRSRNRVAGGEVIESTVEADDILFRKICTHLGMQFKLVGPNCIQFIIDSTTRHPYIMEVNARFGGGATLSIEAGLDMIDMIKKEYVEGQKLCHQTYDNIKVGMKMIRSYKDHYFENSN